MPQERPPKLDLIQGSLDIMVLQTLATMGSLHGYGIARRIEQVGAGLLILNQGTIYASLVRLQHRSWISSEWGTSENNRRARFYSITKAGRKHLTVQANHWEQVSELIGRFLGQKGEA
jgi:transcriptional regulator